MAVSTPNTAGSHGTRAMYRSEATSVDARVKSRNDQTRRVKTHEQKRRPRIEAVAVKRLDLGR